MQRSPFWGPSWVAWVSLTGLKVRCEEAMVWQSGRGGGDWSQGPGLERC